MSEKVRVDVALVEIGLAPSREKAQALIMAGLVYEKEVKITKPSEKVENLDSLSLRGQPHPYVGRGALKLEKALKAFDMEVRGIIAMDIGAATGGFTDVLLQNGAEHVFAIDVGYGQLDWKIRNDSRVTVMERTNARYLTTETLLGAVPSLTVMDVSFISIKLILPVAAALMQGKGSFAVLIKPQFEAGREQVGKKGVVREPSVHEQVIQSIADFAPTFGYALTQIDFSPITGPEGNIEYISELLPTAENAQTISKGRIHEVVATAHATFQKSGG